MGNVNAALEHVESEYWSVLFHDDRIEPRYDETEVCISLKKDDPSVIRRQVERCRAVGYPPQNGMPTCGVLLRRHNDPQLVEAMEAWWREISAGSRRDQLSFPFVAWQHGLGYAPVPGNARDNPVLTWRPHSDGGIRNMFDAGLIRSAQNFSTRSGYGVVKRAMDEEFKR